MHTFPTMIHPTRNNLALAVLLVALLSSHLSSAQVLIGDLTERNHNVNGRVSALSERVLQIENFEYDGLGPAVYFWIDTSAAPTDSGVALASPWNACQGRLSQGADGTVTVLVELPPEAGVVSDYAGGSLSVWCEEFSANFGEVVIPSTLSGVPGEDFLPLECFDDDNTGVGGSPTEAPVVPPPEETPEIAVTPEGYNCEPLHETLQVRWQVDGDNLNVELVGRVEDGEYMAFGPSGSDDATMMLGADPVVVDIDPSDGSFRARDLYMGVRSQCSAGNGVCPDGQFTFFDDVTNVSGEQDSGLTLIRYTRPLTPSNVDSVDSNGFSIDRAISMDGDTFVAWAIGPVSATNSFPNFHTIYPGSNDEDPNYIINFGRDVVDNCTPLAGDQVGDGTETVQPFDRPVLEDVTDFTAHIGPSGGPRGYLAISEGRTAWGISWYLNGYIVPELKLKRGTTYKFLVNGGDDETNDSQHHPFYITDSIAGGYAGLTPLKRAEETVYAGIDIITQSEAEGVTEFQPTTVGPICLYTAGSDTAAAFDGLVDYEEYFATLDSSCANDAAITDAAGVLEFTPDENTPDTLYYHCVTHQNLGWKIRIVDGEGDETSTAAKPISFYFTLSIGILLAIIL